MNCFSDLTILHSHIHSNFIPFCRLQHNKKYLRRQARKIQEQSRQNRENYLPQASSFIPRTERIPAEASRQPSPAEFAEILIKKLEKVKREQELDEKLNKKLAEDAQSMVSQGSNRSLADILREKLIVTDDMDGDQSILDDHVSRIWTDKTPLRSPGDPRYILLPLMLSSIFNVIFFFQWSSSQPRLRRPVSRSPGGGVKVSDGASASQTQRGSGRRHARPDPASVSSGPRLLRPRARARLWASAAAARGRGGQ